MSEQTVSTRAGSIALSRTGTGPALLLLHGLPGSRRSWDDVAPLLPSDLDLVVPDLLGFGGSDKPHDLDALHVAAQADAVLDVLDALGIAQATLVGHDFGGPVALAVLARAPQRVDGLGLLATNAFVDTPVPFPLNTVSWPVAGRLTSRVLFSPPSLRMMLRTGVGTPRVALPVSTYVGSRAQQRCIATIFSGSLRDLARLYTPVQDALMGSGVPGFVLWGDHDPFFSIAQGRRTAEALGAPFTLLEGAGHFLPAERPAEVASAIAELLTRSSSHSPPS